MALYRLSPLGPSRFRRGVQQHVRQVELEALVKRFHNVTANVTNLFAQSGVNDNKPVSQPVYSFAA